MADDLIQSLDRLTVTDGSPDSPPPSYDASLSPAPAIATSPVATATTVAVSQARRGSRRSPKHAAYVVFVGKQAGVYRTWSECQALVDNVGHSVHHAYTTVSGANSAFEAARSQGLTFSCGDGSVAVGRRCTATRLEPADLILCLAFIDDPTSIIIAPERHRWYVVYKGIQPGIYRTYLEASLQTSGIQGARHDSHLSREDAISAFTRALEGGRVYRLSCVTAD